MSKPTIENKRIINILEMANKNIAINGINFMQKTFSSDENHYIVLDELDNVLIYQRGKLLLSKYIKNSFKVFPITAIKESMNELLHILIPQQLINIYVETND